MAHENYEFGLGSSAPTAEAPPCAIESKRVVIRQHPGDTNRFFTRSLRALLLVAVLSTTVFSQTKPDTAIGPQATVELDDFSYRLTAHTINKLDLVVSNRGVLGKPLRPWIEELDSHTGAVIVDGLVFPRNSYRRLLHALDFWIGARTRTGVTVSNGKGFLMTEGDLMPVDPPGSIERRSNVDILGEPDGAAVSEEDLVCEYTDSLRIVRLVGGVRFGAAENLDRLGIHVRQATYGWSFAYAEDFIIVDVRIKNTSSESLSDVYAGIHVSPSVRLANPYQRCDVPSHVFGYKSAVPSAFGCNHDDTLSLAWYSSSSGYPHEGVWLDDRRDWILVPAEQCYWASHRHAFGILPLATPSAGLPLQFSWWSVVRREEEPRLFYFEPTQESDVVAYQSGRNYIDTDEERYRLLSTREIDYPSYVAGAVNLLTATDWKHVPQSAADAAAVGIWDGESLLAWGPIELPPGAEFPITFAIVATENLHVDPANYLNLPQNPSEYHANLDFSDMQQDALMAQWLYDNPGIDTDGDGYRGRFRVCVRDSALVNGEWVINKADTQWYKGDGIPDYRGGLPPPAPEFWLTPVQNGIHIRFNGQVTETEKDIFLQKPDFEGYRVYLGRDEREASLSLVASYDIEDYDKYYLDMSLEQPTWRLAGEPFTKRELSCLYGAGSEPCEDSTFDPLVYTQTRPYRHPDFPNDSLFWFKAHEYNASEFGVSTPIRRRFPEVPDPRGLPADSVTPDMYTEDGYLKFYEYELTIENLLPTVTYWVNVTAFDYGSPAQGVNPLETGRTEGVEPVYPLYERDAPVSGSNEVYVYPNPYRIDADYRDRGYEGRNQDDRWDERVRSIWFANLPPECSISIYTLDGDRVRTMDHRSSASDPTHHRKRWDLINRNFQKVETGLYYWVVETPEGATQMGKLAIIR